MYQEFFCFRGYSSHQAEAFRGCYSQLSELWSLVYQRVPVLALTATATKDVRNSIVKSLALDCPKIISSTPERKNIRYTVIKVTTRDPKNFLDHIIKDLKENGTSSEKILC